MKHDKILLLNYLNKEDNDKNKSYISNKKKYSFYNIINKYNRNIKINEELINNKNKVHILNKKNKELKNEYNENEKYNKDLMNKNYDYYIFAIKQLDNIKGKGINYFNFNYIENINTNKDKLQKIVKIFNKEEEEKNIRNKNFSLIRKNIKQNILEEHIRNIEYRKVSNNLLNPHYFFTVRYNEKSMPTQTKH